MAVCAGRDGVSKLPITGGVACIGVSVAENPSGGGGVLAAIGVKLGRERL